MSKNIGNKERIARVMIGGLVASLAFWGPASPWFLIGIVPMVTGLVGWCPPYSLFGINTACPAKAKSTTA